jgi:membrane protein required for beta-lactamase induction
MSFLAIIVTLILEQQKLLGNVRTWFNMKIEQYADLFINRDFHTVREIRLHFVYALIPFLIVTLFLLILPYSSHHIPYFLINCSLFILCSDLLGWKEEAKHCQRSRDFQQFVQTFATRFFATTFWFIVFPSVLGAICYLVLNTMGNKLREKGEESMVYTVVVDKMLFWINVLPYSVLFIFIAAAGDFEEVMHYVLEQRGKIKVSYFYLENALNEIAFLAIGKEKFTNARQDIDDEIIEDLRNNDNLFNPRIVDYVVALLYRSGLFFIVAISIISIINLL